VTRLPHFWPRGWLRGWGWLNHPYGQGGGPATPKRPKKRKNKTAFRLLRVADTTPRPLVVARPPSKTQTFFFLAFWGWFDHEPPPNQPWAFFYFFFSFNVLHFIFIFKEKIIILIPKTVSFWAS
jgi:hypothetical protein